MRLVEPGAVPSGDTDFPLLSVERPGRRGPRTIGAYVRTGGEIRYLPAVDVERLVLGAVTVAGVAAVLGSALHRQPAVGPVTMGPGGWVSVRGARGALPRLRGRATGRRPWWARLLHAHRLVVQP